MPTESEFGLSQSDEQRLEELLLAYRNASPDPRGNILRDKAIKAILDLIAKKQRAVYAAEKRQIAEIASANGYESLTTDTKGARSLTWLNTTGLAFSTGVASRCIAVAVYHPDIGMGAAHRNTFVLKDVELNIRRQLENQNLAALLSGLQGRPETPDEHLKSYIGTAVYDAFYQFASLFKGAGVSTFPHNRTQVIWTGCEFMTAPEQTRYNQFIQAEVIPTIPLLHDGKARTTGRVISPFPNLGTKGAIITGGPNHPLYPGPYLLT